MSRMNMLTLDCDWDNCDFQTPPLNREHYQAMVAHLQIHAVLTHGASLPSPFAANLNHSGFDVGHLDHASSNTRSRSRSRSRRRERSFQCEKCPGRAYETERGLINHQQRYCGKPKEEGVFPCNHCDQVFVTSGLLSMHKGRFHTDRSSARDGEGASMERSNLIDNNEGKAVDSQGENNVKAPRRYEASVEGVVASKGGSSENNNVVHLRNRSASRGQGSSNTALVGGQQDERVVQEDFAKDGAGTSTSIANFVKDGVPGVGISRVEGGRSLSPALSVFSGASDASSTVEGIMVNKTLLRVDMVLQNLVTRVTYRVMSAAPISIIIPKVASKLGVKQEKVQLRSLNLDRILGRIRPRHLSRESGVLVNVTSRAEEFKDRVICAVIV